jgi:hypothetical protein
MAIRSRSGGDKTMRTENHEHGPSAAEAGAEFLKANGAAAFLSVSRRTFERMKDAGQIPYIRCGERSRASIQEKRPYLSDESVDRSIGGEP